MSKREVLTSTSPPHRSCCSSCVCPPASSTNSLPRTPIVDQYRELFPTPITPKYDFGQSY